MVVVVGPAIVKLFFLTSYFVHQARAPGRLIAQKQKSESGNENGHSISEALDLLDSAVGVTASHVTLVTHRDAREFMRQRVSNGRDRSVMAAKPSTFCSLMSREDERSRSKWARQSLIIVHGLEWNSKEEEVVITEGEEDQLECFQGRQS